MDSHLVTAHGKSLTNASFTKNESVTPDISVRMKDRILQGYGLKVKETHIILLHVVHVIQWTFNDDFILCFVCNDVVSDDYLHDLG